MPKRKLPGKKQLGKTQAGKRALAGARSGKGGIKNPDGSKSSVKTATYDIPGRKGRTDVMVAPTIRKNPKTGKLEQLSAREAARVATETGDFVRVKGGRTQRSVERARAKGDAKSRKFSKRLGNVSQRSERQRKIDAAKKRLRGK